MLLVFMLVAGLWITQAWHSIHYAVVALVGVARAAAHARARVGRHHVAAPGVGRVHLVRRARADGRGVRRDGHHQAIRRGGGGVDGGLDLVGGAGRAAR